ncbi:pilus assembly FimT family protein [Gallibacterium genomosp. 3]|uniref:N-terminal cleavage protein n=1 Tax=Gallibacterium genomosp. 3 TaxID=505345 RepID=A0A1A7QCT8_9PAST|nr:hypothetical protein [Gallibacterium genomosp. 3]OBX11230.1 hypothetical protein QV07_01885 [Gallibacterium genomosp. 3]
MQRYYVGLTVIEVLTVMSIIALLSLFAVPSWQYLHTQLRFHLEQWRLQQFLLQVQQRVNHSDTNWGLYASVSNDQQKWCLIAQIAKEKNTDLCDCLRLSSCSQDTKLVYFPQSTAKIRLITKQYYPQAITFFNHTRHTMRNACFLLQSDHKQLVFKYSGVGGVKIDEQSSTSACLQYQS